MNILRDKPTLTKAFADSQKPLPRARLRHIPPVAVPITAGDLWQGALGALSPGAAHDRFRAQICAYTGADVCLLTSSGRAALAIILLTLRRLSPRRRVIVPAFSCPTVVQAILAAELTPLFCDVTPQTLAMDPDQLGVLMEQQPLAIIVTYLYGLVHEIGELVAAARDHGIFIIEDAAQAFGAACAGHKAGAGGDFGFFSLGRGKCVPAGHGGVVLCRAPYAATLAETVGALSTGELKRGPSALFAFLAYGIATRPAAWWFVARSALNPAAAGMQVAQLPPIELDGQSGAHAALGNSILSRLELLMARRRCNARRLRSVLGGYDYVSVSPVPADAEPAYLRLPFIVGFPDRAQTLYDLLFAAGIGASRSYTHSLPELFADQLNVSASGYPGAGCLARCLLTLPTHHYLQERDIETIDQILARVARYKEH